MTHVVVMPVGPGDREVARADDVIESVVHWEPSIARIVLVDDAPHDRDLSTMLGRPGRPVTVINNPRDGAGDGLWGGLAAGMLHAYGWVQRELHPDLVVKLDTDALVIAPFAQRVADALAPQRVGMIGTCRRHCDGRARALDKWDFRVRRRRFPVRPWRRGGVETGRLELRHTLRGSPAVIRRRIVKARRSGYEYGVHCLGGAYAIGGRVLDRLATEQAFDEWRAWVDLDIGEDVCTSIYVQSAGFALADANQRGQVFGIEYDTLPLPLAGLVEAGYAIVHTVKDQDGLSETSIREFFQARRVRSQDEGPVPDRGNDHREALGEVGHEGAGNGG